MDLKLRVVVGVLAGAIALGASGAMASAAVQPPARSAAATETGPKNERSVLMFTAVLERLAANGVITADQKTQILEAIRTAAERRDGETELKRILAALNGIAVEYLGLPAEDVRAALRSGRSLGDLANATEGKSRDELIAFIVVELTARLGRAVTDGRITEERAATAAAGLGERVAAFVDRAQKADHGKERAKEARERAKERSAEQLERARERMEREIERARERFERARERFERAREKLD